MGHVVAVCTKMLEMHYNDNDIRTGAARRRVVRLMGCPSTHCYRGRIDKIKAVTGG